MNVLVNQYMLIFSIKNNKGNLINYAIIYIMEILNGITSFLKTYGPIGIIIHITISLISLTIIYLLLTYGIELKSNLKSIGIDLDKYSWTQTAGELALAFAIYKIISPLRYGLVILLVPLVKRLIQGKEKDEVTLDSENTESEPLNKDN